MATNEAESQNQQSEGAVSQRSGLKSLNILLTRRKIAGEPKVNTPSVYNLAHSPQFRRRFTPSEVYELRAAALQEVQMTHQRAYCRQ